VEIVRLHLSVIQALNNIPVHGFVIKHPSVGAILVDTGVGYPEALVKEWKVVNRHVADALAEHDLSPADVRIVVNTHLHFDHCGQNAVFKHAPFYVQRAELDRARKENDITNQWFDFAGAKYELLDGDAEIAEGVRAVATPGHTVGHQSVIDFRWYLVGRRGADEYAKGHIPGAAFVELDDVTGKGPGRHPLPSLEQFQATMREAGVDDSAAVVAYDDVGGSVAARLWFLLRWFGHERQAVLDGGLQAWGEPLETAAPRVREGTFTARRPDRSRILDFAEVAQHPGVPVIDSR